MMTEITGATLAKAIGINMLLGAATGVGMVVATTVSLKIAKKFAPDVFGAAKVTKITKEE